MSEEQTHLEHVERTLIGTVIRTIWSKEYYQLVLRAEKQVHKPICGAPTKKKYPCRNFPQEEYGWYCGIHKGLKNINPNDSPAVTLPSAYSSGSTSNSNTTVIHIHSLAELRLQFHQCDGCYIRDRCPSFEAESHCRIEEDHFHGFIDTLRDNYQISQIDMYTASKAALMYGKSVYAEMMEVQWQVGSKEAYDMQKSSIRMSKEFRDCVKALGLTRDQRNRTYQKDMKLGLEGVKVQQTQASLAERMARTQMKMEAREKQKQDQEPHSEKDVEDNL